MRNATWIKCTGEAHSNPHIDNCMRCVPEWGWVVACPDCGDKLRRGKVRTRGRCDNSACASHRRYFELGYSPDVIRARLIALITRECATEVTCEAMDDSPEGYFAMGSDEADKLAALQTRSLAETTPWGWCVAFVRITWRELTHHTTLGACSYESQEAFERDNLETMRDESIDALADRIIAVHAKYAAILAEVS